MLLRRACGTRFTSFLHSGSALPIRSSGTIERNGLVYVHRSKIQCLNLSPFQIVNVSPNAYFSPISNPSRVYV